MSVQPDGDDLQAIEEEKTRLFAEIGRQAFEDEWYIDPEDRRCHLCSETDGFHGPNCPAGKLRQFKMAQERREWKNRWY